MALPIIIINSATGSDTTASGAGPGDGAHTGTVLSGTSNASTDAAGTTVTLPAGTDLTNVTTDGSSVIFINDATAGNRNFSKITATAGSGGATPTVTVSDAFGINLTTQSWAIGGKRASLLGTTSSKLIENNAAAGDAMPGWTMQMESGHSETRASSINPRRAGDSTNGKITVRGAAGAITRPLLTFSNNGDAFTVRALGWTFRDFEIQNSNATKTVSIAFDASFGSLDIINVKCADATNKFWQFFAQFGNISETHFFDCEIGNLANAAFVLSSAGAGIQLTNNIIYKCGANVIQCSSSNSLFLRGNIIAYNTGVGLILSGGGGDKIIQVEGNVFHGNSSDAIQCTANYSTTTPCIGMLIENNRFTYNGAYGINFNGTGYSDAALTFGGVTLRNNNFFANTTNKYNPTTLTISQNEITTDPSGGLASTTKDYTGTVSGTNFMSGVGKGLGYPGSSLPVGTSSSSTNYTDIGLQHQDTGGGGSGGGAPIIGSSIVRGLGRIA